MNINYEGTKKKHIQDKYASGLWAGGIQEFSIFPYVLGELGGENNPRTKSLTNGQTNLR